MIDVLVVLLHIITPKKIVLSTIQGIIGKIKLYFVQQRKPTNIMENSY